MKNLILMGLVVISYVVLLTSCGAKEEKEVTATENVATNSVATENTTSNVEDSTIVE
jgi:hypothetical protein